MAANMKGRLLALARGFALVLGFVVPFIAFYYFVLTWFTSTSNILMAVNFLQLFISPLLWLPFFILYRSKFNLVTILLVVYAGA